MPIGQLKTEFALLGFIKSTILAIIMNVQYSHLENISLSELSAFKYSIKIICYQDWATVPLMQTFNIILWLLKDFTSYLKYHVKSFYYAVI